MGVEKGNSQRENPQFLIERESVASLCSSVQKSPQQPQSAEPCLCVILNRGFKRPGFGVKRQNSDE